MQNAMQSAMQNAMHLGLLEIRPLNVAPFETFEPHSEEIENFSEVFDP